MNRFLLRRASAIVAAALLDMAAIAAVGRTELTEPRSTQERKASAPLLAQVSEWPASSAMENPKTRPRLAKSAPSNPARIRDCHGTGTVEYGATIRPCKTGQVLLEGAIIRTGKNGMVDFRLGDDGPAVRVMPDSELVLQQLNSQAMGVEIVRETVLDLRKGRLLGNGMRMPVLSKYEIKTPVGVVVLGGAYDIASNGGIKVFSGSGSVDFISTNGVKTTLAPSEDPPMPKANPAAAIPRREIAGPRTGHRPY